MISSTIAILFLLAFVASILLYTFLGNPFWIRLLRNTRGTMGMLDYALAERGDGGACGLPRPPTGKYPYFSRTIGGTLDAAGNGAVNFDAERDTLFIGMSADIADAAPTSATISMTYCNTRMLVNSSRLQWTRCCDRKPIFLVGVADNKRLEFTIAGGTPAGAFSITLHGFQGKGCCG